MSTADFAILSQKIDALRDEMIALQALMIAAPAVGPDNQGPGEWAKAQVVRAVLETFADRIEECHAPDARVTGGLRPNFIATVRGQRSNRRVWMVAHMDVVPPGNVAEWKTPPFQAVVKDGRIYGRGAEDNHQGLVSSVFAAKAFVTAGITPPCDIGLLLLSDEETGNAFGIDYVLRTANPLRPGDIVMVPDGGPPTGDMIEIAEKGGLWVKFTVHGKTTHGSTPNMGINAHRAAGYMIAALDALQQRFPLRNDVFFPPASTFEPTVSYGNEVSVNVIPGTASFVYDCRLLPGVAGTDVLNAMREIATGIEQTQRVAIAIETVRSFDPAPATQADAPVVQLTSAAAQAVYGVTPKLFGHGGGSIAKPIRDLGIPAVVYSKTDETLHTPNEYCVIDNMVGDCKVFAHIALHAGDVA